METMTEKQETLGQLEQALERCLEKHLGQLISAIQNQALLPPRDSGLERELMQEGFKQMNKRFEMIDKRFEAVDKRFEAMDKRFEEMRSDMDRRFEEARSDSNTRFEMLIASTDKRFEELRSDMNTRFTFMQWMILSGFGLLAFLMSFYKFFP